jgi:hypothetical protein
MKYLKFWEFVSGVTMKEAIQKNIEYSEEVKKNPDKYPQVLYAGGIIVVGGGKAIKGFEVLEATEEQVMNDVLYWLEIVSEEYIPILDSTKGGPLIMAKYGFDQ